MGYKAIATASTLSTLAVTLNAVGCGLPVHYLSFYTLFGVARVFRGRTYLLSFKIQDYSNDFCKFLPARMCTGLHEVHDLQDIAERFCSPAASTIFPALCMAFDSAYLIGIFMVVTVVANAIGFIIANAILWDYILRSPKQRYRTSATMFMAFAILLQLSVQLVYALLVIQPLDNADPNVLTRVLMSPSKTSGVGKGFLSMCVSLFVQIIVVAIVILCAKTSSELDDAEIEEGKERAAILAEQQKLAYGDTRGSFGVPSIGYGYGSAAGQQSSYSQPPLQVIYGEASAVVSMGSDIVQQQPTPVSSQPQSPPPMTPAF